MEVTKKEVEELLNEVKRGYEDEMVGSFSHIDFKDYTTQKQAIEDGLKALGLSEVVEVEYNFMGITINYKRG